MTKNHYTPVNLLKRGMIATLLLTATFSFLQAEPVPRKEVIKPIQPVEATDTAKVELGKKLWFDPRLSKSGFISCNSCHNLSMGGSDNLPTSIGHDWQEGPINSPTVLNSTLNFVQFWDGRAKDLKEQAAGPIENPKEMAASHELVADVIQSIPQYVDEFAAIYGDREVNIDRITDAIAVFEETLITPNSRFDQWLYGDDDALTEVELAGYELFKSSGCTACHFGENIGGSSFQKMGLHEDYITENLAQGRADVTGADRDRMLFKVPTLRNVELTYPYFHDGAAHTLEEAVDIMGRLQLARTYEDEEIGQIVAWLKTLTGDQPEIVLPILPPSNNDTPRPEPFTQN